MMKQDQTITNRLVAYYRKDLPMDFKGLPPTIDNNRTFNIIAHYQSAIDKGHMSLNAAVDRAIGDIAGLNRHPNRDQRSV